MTTYAELLSASGSTPEVVLFYGAACQPCERLKPKLRLICERAKLTLHELNSAGELPALAALKVRTVPAAVLLWNGTEKVLFTGDVEGDTIRTRLQEQGVPIAENLESKAF